MRPILRGPKPVDSHGSEKVFSKYEQARADLIERLGQYCSYCEMKLDTSLAVEHVQPKKPPGATQNDRQRELSWENFLLACTNCNSTKGNTNVVLNEYYWPDRDNTFRAFTYSEGGRIEPSGDLDGDQTSKAENTIDLTGLDKHPLNDSAASDRRWFNRREVWEIALESWNDLQANDTPQMRRQIVRTATGHAYWSVWMTVFQDDVDMLKRFIQAFLGTAADCFDDACQPVARPGGQI